ncbi:hypothetical protein ACFSL6_01355 [Paenibacillus thailandensis]|uniref:Glycoside hydrolase n=1 Tax=Paenibacillus thailandensis TaxID=393250 RepID=A0ABW5R2U7_9BACL
MLKQSEFANPGPEYRIHPFWFWNGEMEDAVIREQVREMADKGVGGFFLCARQGLEVPYLSKAWFDKVRVAVQEAEACGLHVWLYDEFPYPSGMAGGETVLLHPEAKLRTLECKRAPVRGGERLTLALPWAKALYARAVPVAGGKRDWERSVDLADYIGSVQTEPVFQKTGLTAYNDKRYFTYGTAMRLEWTAPEGEWEALVVLEKEIGDFKYYGTYVDPCNAEAMETFIRLTHGRYEKHLKPYFGSVIKGVFSDEVGLLGAMPWSPRLAERFRAEFGYDLGGKLYALYDDEAPEAGRVRQHYYQAIHLLLREAYHRQVADWCRSRGLQYVAEAPSVRHATLDCTDIPGGDAGHEKLGRPLGWLLRRNAAHFRYNPKMVSSLARQLSKPRNLIECFHSVGWSMTLQDAKWMIDRLASLGTNMFNFHAFFYTLDGMRKHDAPPSQFVQNPYWSHFGKLADYTGRISLVMSSGSAVIATALIEPTATLWSKLGNPFHGFSYGGGDPEEKEELARLRGWWIEAMAALPEHGRDYDHLDPELLAEADVEDGIVKLGTARYECVVLPPMIELEPKAWDRIERFLRQGGKVVALGRLPERSAGGEGAEAAFADAVRQTFGCEAGYPADRPLEESWRKGERDAYFLPFAEDADPQAVMAEACRKLEELQPLPARLDAGGERGTTLLHVRRLDGGDVAVFIANQEGGTIRGELTLRLAALFRDALEEGEDRRGIRAIECETMCLETGAVVPHCILEADEADAVSLPVELAPYASVLYRFRPAPALSELPGSAEPPGPAAPGAFAGLAGPANSAEPWVWKLDASGPWSVTLRRSNALRLGRFRFGIATEDARYVSKAAVTVEPKTLIDQCEDLARAEGEGLPIRMRQPFGTPMRMELPYPLYASYSASFELDGALSGIRLVMDEEAVAGKTEIAVNGKLLAPEGWQPAFLYDHRNRAYEITPLLVQGRNEITVHVRAERDSDGLNDPLYVTGDFHVRLSEAGEPVLVPAEPLLLPLRSGPWSRFPHYAGELSFRAAAELSEVPAASSFELVFDQWDEHFHDVAEVRVNGAPLGARAWTPYRWQGDTAVLKAGRNEIEVIVTDSLAGLLEGRYFDYARHELRSVFEPGE